MIDPCAPKCPPKLGPFFSPSLGTVRPSVGQAGCNALGRWMRQQFGTDVVVYDRWPEPSVKLAPKAVTIVKIGKRQRLDVVDTGVLDDMTPLPGGISAVATFRIGSYIQPIQLDVWAQSDAERDDMIRQLDDMLTTGAGITLGPSVTDDPVRDGVLLPLDMADGYCGNVDCWLDEPEINDTPDAVQRSEFRAMYVGEIRGAFSRAIAVPIMTAITLKTKYGPQAVPVQALYETLTLTPTGVVHGTSSA